MITRIAAVQRELRSLDIPAVLITNLTDVRYLSGFTGTTAYMLVDIEKAVFFYRQQIQYSGSRRSF